MNIDNILDKFISDNRDNMDIGIKHVYAESALNTIGQYSPFVDQFYSDTCAIRSQQIILRDYGINVSQEQLISLAEDKGWYNPGEGTPVNHVGKLMTMLGVECHQSQNNSVYDLVSELSQGHRVIVSVDSGELWANTFIDVLGEKLEDISGNSAADHALIVAGVEVNPNNPQDVSVVLTDPGSGNLRVKYSLSEFMDAWKDSNCFMVSTEEAAPYQFDPITQCEVPSGFATDFQLNNFVVENNLFMDEAEIFMPNDFSPYYEIGDFAFSDFHTDDIYSGNDFSLDDFGIINTD